MTSFYDPYYYSTTTYDVQTEPKVGKPKRKSQKRKAKNTDFKPKADPVVKQPKVPTGFQIGRYENGAFFIKNGANPAIAYSNEFEALNALAKKLGIEQPAAAQGAGTGAPAPKPPVQSSGFAPFRDADEYAKRLEGNKPNPASDPKFEPKPEPKTPKNTGKKPYVKSETTVKSQIFPHKDGNVYAEMLGDKAEQSSKANIFPHKDGKVYAEMLEGEKGNLKIGEKAVKGSKGFWSTLGSAIKNNKGKAAVATLITTAVGAGIVAMCSGGDKAEDADADLDESKVTAPEDTGTEEAPEEGAPAEETPETEEPSTTPTFPSVVEVPEETEETEEAENEGKVDGAGKTDGKDKPKKADGKDEAEGAEGVAKPEEAEGAEKPENKEETVKLGEYIVKKGDNVWNIAKANLIEQNKDVEGYKPTDGQILKETNRLIENNKLKWEPDHYHVIIHAGQKLNLAA